jgi:hypothetical protein
LVCSWSLGFFFIFNVQAYNIKLGLIINSWFVFIPWGVLGGRMFCKTVDAKLDRLFILAEAYFKSKGGHFNNKKYFICNEKDGVGLIVCSDAGTNYKSELFPTIDEAINELINKFVSYIKKQVENLTCEIDEVSVRLERLQENKNKLQQILEN